MQWEEAAAGFAAMGSEARLKVLHMLIRAGEDGLSVSDLQDRTGIAPSTLAHHLKFLAGAELITQSKQGRTVLSHADFDKLHELADCILAECCADVIREAANDG